MFDPDIHQSLIAELECVSAELQSAINPTNSAPEQLFHFTDAAGLQRLVKEQALHALHSRLGWGDDVTGYGVDFVRSFLQSRAATSAPGASAEFCAALLANFNPRGSHFDCFLARLFENADCPDKPGNPGQGYALGLATGHMALRAEQRHQGASVLLQQAIYTREQQIAIVERLYTSYESFYAGSLARHGEASRDTILTPCWDMFRRDI